MKRCVSLKSFPDRLQLNHNRMILPLKKFQLPEGVTSQAIPMLSDRQFVVDKTKLSLEEDKLQRELFWYREELFKCVHGHWREVRPRRLVISNPSVLIIHGIGGWDPVG
jgi:Transport protein Trs120 or TRAPPC9, TRAPP II complex subunit